MTSADVLVTSFGVVRFGPKFQALLDGLKPDLAAGKWTKRHKHARQKLERLEMAVCVLAEAEWLAGDVLNETP